MDLQSVITRVTKLDGRVKELALDDRQLIELIAFVCEALCEVQPHIRDGLADRISHTLSEEFQDYDYRGRDAAPTLRAGLESILKRIEPS